MEYNSINNLYDKKTTISTVNVTSKTIIDKYDSTNIKSSQVKSRFDKFVYEDLSEIELIEDNNNFEEPLISEFENENHNMIPIFPYKKDKDTKNKGKNPITRIVKKYFKSIGKLYPIFVVLSTLIYCFILFLLFSKL